MFSLGLFGSWLWGLFIFAYGKRHGTSRHPPLKQRRKGSILWVYTNTAVLPCSLPLVFAVRLSKNNHEDSHHFLEASLNGLLLINCQEIISLKPCFRLFVCLFPVTFLLCPYASSFSPPIPLRVSTSRHPDFAHREGSGESPRSRSGPGGSSVAPARSWSRSFATCRVPGGTLGLRLLP